MANATLVVGSLATLTDVLAEGTMILASSWRVVIVPTAAAFFGAESAAVAAATALECLHADVETLMVTDRRASARADLAQRIDVANLVVLCDGSPLHPRSVWRDSPVGEAIARSNTLVAVGGVATVLGDVMVDPRGGAPTTGLGWRPGIVWGTEASPDQLERTRDLLGTDVTFVVVGPTGAVLNDGRGWRVVRDGVVATRGREVVALGVGL